MIVYYTHSDIDWPIETHTLLNIDGIGLFLYRSLPLPSPLTHANGMRSIVSHRS